MNYVLYNEEFGYIDTCPIYEDQYIAIAEKDAASKCRKYSVLVYDREITPCTPKSLHSNCLMCARCASSIASRKDFLSTLNIK